MGQSSRLQQFELLSPAHVARFPAVSSAGPGRLVVVLEEVGDEGVVELASGHPGAVFDEVDWRRHAGGRESKWSTERWGRDGAFAKGC